MKKINVLSRKTEAVLLKEFNEQSKEIKALLQDIHQYVSNEKLTQQQVDALIADILIQLCLSKISVKQLRQAIMNRYVSTLRRDVVEQLSLKISNLTEETGVYVAYAKINGNLNPKYILRVLESKKLEVLTLAEILNN